MSEANNEAENLHPEQIDVINEAIAIAEQALLMEESNNPDTLQTHKSVIEGLHKRRETILSGKNKYLHNIVRYDQWEFNRIRNPNFIGKLGNILESREIEPRKGTFTKGTYFAGANIATDDVSLLPALFMEGKGVPTSETPVCILELDMPDNMEDFKHQGCVVINRPQSLSKLKRVIVAPSDMDGTRKTLDENGYTDVDVVSYEVWQLEMICIEAAQANLVKN